jgi:hypothetical protein
MLELFRALILAVLAVCIETGAEPLASLTGVEFGWVKASLIFSGILVYLVVDRLSSKLIRFGFWRRRSFALSRYEGFWVSVSAADESTFSLSRISYSPHHMAWCHAGFGYSRAVEPRKQWRVYSRYHDAERGEWFFSGETRRIVPNGRRYSALGWQEQISILALLGHLSRGMTSIFVDNPYSAGLRDNVETAYTGRAEMTLVEQNLLRQLLKRQETELENVTPAEARTLFAYFFSDDLKELDSRSASTREPPRATGPI